MRPEKEQLVERMGRRFEADGVPRIGGRLYGFLLFTEKPCSLDELASELQVSKTSVSTNARLLETIAMIRRVTKPGDRRDFYEVAADTRKTLEVRLGQLRELIGILEDALDVTPEEEATVRDRVSEMLRFNREALEALESLLGMWRARAERDGDSG